MYIFIMKLDGYSKYEIYPEDGKIWSYRSNRFIGAFDKNGNMWMIILLIGGKMKWKRLSYKTTLIYFKYLFPCLSALILDTKMNPT